MNPDTPAPAPTAEKRRKLLMIGVVAAAWIIVIGALVYPSSDDQPQSPVANPQPHTSAPRRVVVATTAPTEIDTNPAFSQTCSDSRAWDQKGDTELIDAYINNQDTGNVVVADLKAGCPQYLPVWQKAQGGISGGTSAVPADAKPGTYETTSSSIEDCYWERSRNGQIVANNFITASTVKQRVTIRSTDDTFVSQGCGSWIKVS